MNRATKRIGCIGLALAVVMAATIPVQAAADYRKDEVVYVNLTHSGDVDAIYVVNSFDLATGGSITDRGGYSEVMNLTTTDPIRLRGDTVSVRAPGGKFYYEGVLEKRDIPWELSVAYRLDGKAVDGERLAGQSGQLEIDIGIHQKEDADEIWRDNYAIQASLSLDSENCVNIHAPDATIASVGDQKQLSYIVLPGKDKDFSITADVRGFELSGIRFNMVPLSLSIDDPDTAEIKDKLYELQDGAVELDDGAFELDDGVVELLDGAEQLDDGATKLDDGVVQLQDGMVELNDGVVDLTDGAGDLREGAGDLLDGAREIKRGTGDLASGVAAMESGAAAFADGLAQLHSQSAPLADGSAQVKAGLGRLAKAVDGTDTANAMQGQAAQLKGASQDYLNALDDLIALYEGQLAQIPSLGYSAPSANPSGERDGNPERDVPAQAQLLRETIAVLRELRNNYAHINAGVGQMSDTVVQSAESLPALAEGVLTLATQYDQLDAGIGAYTQGVGQLYDSVGALADGVSTLSDGVAKLDDGAAELRDGAEELYDGSYDLQDGVRKLADGTVQLDDGVTELRDGVVELKDGTIELRDGAVELKDGATELRDGTAELRDRTADMDVEVDDKIDEMMEEYRNKDFTPLSFVDASNPNVNAVQFVMKTAEISIEDDGVETVADEAPLTMWQRFRNLFSFLKKDEQ